MEVPVAGVEHVRDPQPVLGGQRVDPPQHLGQARARDHAVLDVVGGGDPAHRGERRLARLPDQVALLPRSARPARRARPRSRTARSAARGPRSALARAGRRARPAAPRPRRAGSRRRWPARRPGSRGDPSSRSRRGRCPASTIAETASPAAPVSSKNATSVRTLSGAGTTRSVILVATPERALGADERARAGRSRGRRGRSSTTRAVAEHDLEAGHVVGREAVLEAVRAARVLGHVAADRADDLARRVRRVEVASARPPGRPPGS